LKKTYTMLAGSS